MFFERLPGKMGKGKYPPPKPRRKTRVGRTLRPSPKKGRRKRGQRKKFL
jgi:hypothetical protein